MKWVLGCNTKHLDDMIDLYTDDAIGAAIQLRFPSAARPRFVSSSLARSTPDSEKSNSIPCAWKSLEILHTSCGTMQGAGSQRQRQTPRRARQVLVGVRPPGRITNGNWRPDCWSADLDSRKPGIRRSPKRWRKNDHPAQGLIIQCESLWRGRLVARNASVGTSACKPASERSVEGARQAHRGEPRPPVWQATPHC